MRTPCADVRHIGAERYCKLQFVQASFMSVRRRICFEGDASVMLLHVIDSRGLEMGFRVFGVA